MREDAARIGLNVLLYAGRQQEAEKFSFVTRLFASRVPKHSRRRAGKHQPGRGDLPAQQHRRGDQRDQPAPWVDQAGAGQNYRDRRHQANGRRIHRV